MLMNAACMHMSASFLLSPYHSFGNYAFNSRHENLAATSNELPETWRRYPVDNNNNYYYDDDDCNNS